MRVLSSTKNTLQIAPNPEPANTRARRQAQGQIGGLEARKIELTQLLANTEAQPPLLHPNMAEICRQRIAVLYESPQSDDGKAEAAEIFRLLID